VSYAQAAEDLGVQGHVHRRRPTWLTRDRSANWYCHLPPPLTISTARGRCCNDPNVLMMKSAQDGVRNYGAGSLNRTRDRRILLQRPMRSNAVVIGRIVFQNSAQMCLAQNDDVIQTLAPDRSDQPFGKAILPRRSWCDRLFPNAHGAQSACDDGTIDAIPVPDHVARSLIPGKCFCYPACNPIRCRVGCHVDPDEISDQAA